MTLKEKLDLLWKYLLLIVLIVGFFQFGRSCPPRMQDRDCGRMPGHSMMRMDKDCVRGDMKRVNVQIEKFEDGDSTMVIMVNGKKVDPKDFDLSKFEDGDDHVMIKKIIRDGKPGKQKIKKMPLKEQ